MAASQMAASWAPALPPGCASVSPSIRWTRAWTLGVKLIPRRHTQCQGVPIDSEGPRQHGSPGAAQGDLAAWCAICCPSPQSSKVLAKRELLFVPLIGWTWYFLEIVFCKRKWEEDRDTVIEGLRRLADYPEYMWVSPCMPAAGTQPHMPGRPPPCSDA